MLLCITSVCSAQNTPAVYKPSSMFPSTTVQQAGRIQPLQRLHNGRRGSNDIVPPSTQFTPATDEPQEAIDASDLDGKLIKSIEFKGHKFMTEQRLMATINSRTDRSFDSGLLQEDVRNLYRTGLIRDVRVVTDRVDDGVCIEFEVFERPTIRSLRFIGNRGILDEKLSTEAGLAAGDALNQYTIEDAKRKIKALYKKYGYPMVDIRILEGDKPGQRDIVFYVIEGPREKVAKVEFIGFDPELTNPARLQSIIQTEKGTLTWLYGGDMNYEKVQEDVDRLVAYYRNLGYFQARVGVETTPDESGHWITVRFIINEGVRYVIRSMQFSGNTEFTDADLMTLMSLSENEPFNLGAMNIDNNSIKSVYGTRGYIFASITPDIRFRETPGELDIVFNVDEGEPFRVGRIDVRIAGENPRTRTDVILNRLSMMPGDMANRRQMESSERRLRHSQLFESNPAMGKPPTIVIREPDLQTIKPQSPLPSAPDPVNVGEEEPTRATVRGQSPERLPDIVPFQRFKDDQDQWRPHR